MLVPKVFKEGSNNIYFYGEVNRNNILTLTSYVRELNDKKIKNINIHMASNGGDLEYGFLAYDLLKRSNKQINTYCEGSVISAGTLIYLAGKNRFITPNSTMLVHQLSGKLYGTYENMEDDMYNSKLSMDNMIKIYKTETTISNKMLHSLLKRNIHLTADECIDYGFAHKII